MRSLYVHIPFCFHICSYCDFCKVYYKKEWADLYLEALQFELNEKGITGYFDTVYIGGGTPSSLSYNQLIRLFEILKPFTKHVKEYTIEVNPETVDEVKINLFDDYHINRLSIGVQTFHDRLLTTIERYHTARSAVELIKLAKSKGIKDINVDLIYGLPNQRLADVYEDIDIIESLNISHVSIYSLILEDHTILKNQNFQPLSDEEDAYWYDSINEYLRKKGFIHYEVSNYYKNKPSFHNLTYWHYNDYLGVGVGAHSLYHHHRLENTKSLTKYLNHDYLMSDTFLSQEDELFETIMMGLRLIKGINIKHINECFQIDFLKKYQEVIKKYTHLNMLCFKDDHLMTTELGMKYLNTILVDFLD